MNNVWLLSGFICLYLIAAVIILYSLRKTLRLPLLILPLLTILLTVLYWQWGSWPLLQKYQADVRQQARAEALLKSIKTPAALIEQLKQRLAARPDGRGWYLLGRIYMSQNKRDLADEAFSRAHQLVPEDEATMVNLALNRWELNNHQFTAFTRNLLTTVLEKNPQQPDALALLAMDASKHHACHKAEYYWEQLLLLLPKDAEAAAAIHQAIKNCTSAAMK